MDKKLFASFSTLVMPAHNFPRHSPLLSDITWVLHRTLSKSGQKCRQHGQKIICAIQYTRAARYTTSRDTQGCSMTLAMSCTELYPYLSRIWERRTECHSHPYVTRDCDSTDFHETRACSNFRTELFIKFHENPTNGLDDATGYKGTDGRTDSLSDFVTTLGIFLRTSQIMSRN